MLPSVEGDATEGGLAPPSTGRAPGIRAVALRCPVDSRAMSAPKPRPTPRFEVDRIGNAPILVPHMDDRMGANLAGPSLIRAPEWLPDRLGEYYLYFAHHNGTYIRLAVADALEGPWRIHTPGALQHSESHFPDELDPQDP